MTKSDTPPSGLYIRISAADDIERSLQNVRQIAMVVNRSNYDKNMHVIEISGNAEDKENLLTLIGVVKSLGIVAILRGPLDLAQNLEADGIILSDTRQADKAREMLGDDAIIGIGCDLGRPEAELIIKQSADYILFGDNERQSLPPLELLRWWTSATDMSSVAAGPVTNDNTKSLVQSGATFLDCTDYVLQHPKGVLQSVANMLHAIDVAAEPQAALN